MSVHMERISTHKKSKRGSRTAEGSILGKDNQSKLVGGVHIGDAFEGYGMYVFVYNAGSENNPRKISETKHCSEAQAKAYKEQLEKSGY